VARSRVAVEPGVGECIVGNGGGQKHGGYELAAVERGVVERVVSSPFRGGGDAWVSPLSAAGVPGATGGRQRGTQAGWARRLAGRSPATLARTVKDARDDQRDFIN